MEGAVVQGHVEPASGFVWPAAAPPGSGGEPSVGALGSAELLGLAARLASAGVGFALITVVRAVRPSSGKAGDKAILTERGEWFGWVGGSCAEPTARRAAQRALEDGQCRLIHLTNDETDVVRSGVEVAAMTCHSGGTLEIYVEPHLPQPLLVVFGRSPIAASLREQGALLGYRVVPVDLSAEGNAAEPALAALARLPSGQRFVVVASHGHFEIEALSWALEGRAAYVGLVTSQRRRADVLQRLRERGLSDADLARLHAPAGLPIGARGPAEVGLSVLSEIVAERQRAGSKVAEPAVVPAAPTVGAAAAQAEDAEDCCSVRQSGAAPVTRAQPSALLTQPSAAAVAPVRVSSCCSVPVLARPAQPVDEPGAAKPTRFSAVVLAAGLSRRMGAPNKLLLPVAGQPLICQVVRSVLATTFVEVVVVLGHQATQVGAAIASLGARTVLNADFESGQVSSVRAGLRALAQPVDAVMICLGDQPFLTASDLSALQAAFARRSHGSILVPMLGEQRGNPVILDWQSAQETLQRGTNFGCRHFMDEHPDRVYRWQAESDRFIRDIDQPADYQALLAPPGS